MQKEFTRKCGRVTAMVHFYNEEFVMFDAYDRDADKWIQRNMTRPVAAFERDYEEFSA